MSHIIFWDVETRSTVSLEDAGAHRYAAEPSTEVLCVAYAIDDAAPKIWTPDQPVPTEFTDAANDPSWCVVAHNFAFERAILTRILRPRYGWPQVPLAQQRCTMAMALAGALPGSLDGAAAALGLPPKDAGGYLVMKKMARPRRPHKNEDPGGVYWHDSTELREQLARYCANDVEVERALFRRLPPLSPEEQVLWQLDAIVNARGFHIDRALAEAARRVVAKEQVAINEEVAQLTNGAVTSINQVAKIIAFVGGRGHQISGLTKRSVSALLAHNPSEEVRRILELRRGGARASVRKLDSLLARVDADDRLRGTLRFHAASTGRWSGRGYQPQNLKKAETKNIDAAVDAILAGDLDCIRALGAPLSVTGDISRSIICAAPGHLLTGADFSAVESRVLAWIAGEEWKLDAYRAFDRTGNSELEPYCVAASKILKRTVTKEDEAGRSIGKTCDLAFGYGGGLGAWRKFDTSDTYSDADVEHFKTAWRNNHAATVRFWRALDHMAHRAIRTGQRVELRNLAFEMDGGTLYLTLPSGRRIAYPEARSIPGKFDGTRELQFKDNANGNWMDCGAWYGTLVENVVQAVSRDLLAAAMQRLEAAGYPIVLHVHDEAVCEVPEGFGSEERFLALMTALPEWAPGLPIAAKPWSRKRYGKAEAKDANAAPGHAGPERIPISTKKPSEPLPWDGPTTFAKQPGPASIVATEDEDEGDGYPPLEIFVDGVNGSGMLCCPFHDDKTPSLKIYDDHFHCFGCGAHGDTIDWLMMVKGMDRDEAVRSLQTWDGPVTPPAPERDPEDATRSALRLWAAAKPIAGTLAAKYLAEVRRIDIAALPADVDEVLRFHPRCPFGPGTQQPCLLALLRDVTTNKPTGIQRIALKPGVFTGDKVERKVLGHLGAAKLWTANSHLVIGEGIETVLAAATCIPYRGEPLRPAWSAISSGALSNLPVIGGVKRLIVLADNDINGEGQAAAARCVERWKRAGRAVVKLMPTRAGTDFNDVIMTENEHARF